MFKLIKLIVWVAGILVIGYLAMEHFGYEINKDYFRYSKEKCQEKLTECTSLVIHQGVDNAKCDFQCVTPSLIINKK